jgi:hypothetical protein
VEEAATFLREAYIFSREAYIFSRAAVTFFSKAMTFFSKAVKISRAATTSLLFPFYHRDSESGKHPTHVAHPAPKLLAPTSQQSMRQERHGRHGWDVFRFHYPYIRARRQGKGGKNDETAKFSPLFMRLFENYSYLCH